MSCSTDFFGGSSLKDFRTPHENISKQPEQASRRKDKPTRSRYTNQTDATIKQFLHDDPLGLSSSIFQKLFRRIKRYLYRSMHHGLTSTRYPEIRRSKPLGTSAELNSQTRNECGGLVGHIALAHHRLAGGLTTDYAFCVPCIDNILTFCCFSRCDTSVTTLGCLFSWLDDNIVFLQSGKLNLLLRYTSLPT